MLTHLEGGGKKISPEERDLSTGLLGFDRELNNAKLKISGMVGFGMGITILKVPKCPVCASLNFMLITFVTIATDRGGSIFIRN